MASFLIVALGQQAQDGPRAKEIDGWVQALGSDKLDEREVAERQIVAIADDVTHILPALDAAKKGSDPDKAARSARARRALVEKLWERVWGDADLPALPKPAKPGDPAIGLEQVRPRIVETGYLAVMVDAAMAGQGGDAAQLYQKFLKYYMTLRRMCAGSEGALLTRLDTFKEVAENAYHGSAALLMEARDVSTALCRAVVAEDAGEAQKLLAQMKDIRAKNEFFHDPRAEELDTLIRAGEEKVATLKKK